MKKKTLICKKQHVRLSYYILEVLSEIFPSNGSSPENQFDKDLFHICAKFWHWVFPQESEQCTGL